MNTYTLPQQAPLYKTVESVLQTHSIRNTPLYEYNDRQIIAHAAAIGFCENLIRDEPDKDILYVTKGASTIFRYFHEYVDAIQGPLIWQQVDFHPDSKTVGIAYITTLGLHAILSDEKEKSFFQLHDTHSSRFKTFIPYFLTAVDIRDQKRKEMKLPHHHIQKQKPPKEILEQKVA